MLRAACVVLLVALSGCTMRQPHPTSTDASQTMDACDDAVEPPGFDVEHSWETLSYALESSGAFTIAVAAPVSAGGTSLDGWFANASAEGRGTITRYQSERGNTLRVEGTGDVQVCAYSLQYPPASNRCCAEQYLNAVWSTRPDNSGAEVVPVKVLSGAVNIELLYEAASDRCSRTADFEGQATSAGWIELAGDDSSSCT